jgi:hypothetical protein
MQAQIRIGQQIDGASKQAWHFPHRGLELLFPRIMRFTERDGQGHGNQESGLAPGSIV